MTKKRILRSCLLVFIFVLLITTGIFTYLVKNYQEHKQTRLEEERMVLQEVSLRTGKLFDDWLSLREYLYCDALKEGMTRVEVMELLSQIDETQVSGDTVDFTNRYIDYYLGPLNLDFTSNGPSGCLKGWGGSTEINLGSPRAHCE
jgi:hypothetical protein